MRDLVSILQPVPCLAPANIQANVQGAPVDCTAYDGVMFAIGVGVLGDTLTTAKYYEFRLRDSLDGITFADVDPKYVQANPQYPQVGTAAEPRVVQVYSPILNTGAAASPAQQFKIGYLGYQPFVTVQVLVTGTMTTGTTIYAVAILGYPRHAPAGMNPQFP